ncbi:MAG: copper ion binding protein [Firmicutes bacterium]|nr:copper ion binding protein [Bacillota bacterium]
MGIAGDSKTTVYNVGGLKGDHCRDRIKHTLDHLEGVFATSVNVVSKTVKVSYDPAVISDGYIEETLQTLGYSIQG